MPRSTRRQQQLDAANAVRIATADVEAKLARILETAMAETRLTAHEKLTLVHVLDALGSVMNRPAARARELAEQAQHAASWNAVAASLLGEGARALARYVEDLNAASDLARPTR